MAISETEPSSRRLLPLSGCCASIRHRIFCPWLLSCFDFFVNVSEGVSKDARQRLQLLLGQLGQGLVADDWRGLHGAIASVRLPCRWLVRGMVCLQQLDQQPVGILHLVPHNFALVIDAFQYTLKRAPAGFVFQNLGGFPLRPLDCNLILGVDV